MNDHCNTIVVNCFIGNIVSREKLQYFVCNFLCNVYFSLHVHSSVILTLYDSEPHVESIVVCVVV